MGGGNCGPSASACLTVFTTVPWLLRVESQSTKAEKSDALTESSAQPLQMSWKTIGTQPPPLDSACVTQVSRVASEIGPVAGSGLLRTPYGLAGGSVSAAGHVAQSVSLRSSPILRADV